jgi:iron complex outermembrane recepter protein
MSSAFRTVRASVAAVLTTFAAANLYAAAPSSDADALEEVVVTAQFREQSVQDTPLSITAISGDLLESRSQTNLAEVTNQAPNVTLKPQGAAFGPALGASIRGVGQFDFNPALEPGVGIYVDDVYYATLTGSILDLLDLERVEILRGPQGTLAGKNSIGGAVKLYSKKPTGEGGSLAATYGSRDRIDFRASGDFALSDNANMRVTGVSKRQAGPVKRLDYGCKFPTSGVPILDATRGDCVLGTMGDVNYTALRAQLNWQATENFEVNTSLDFTDDDRTPAGQVMVQGSTAVNPNIQPVLGVTNLSLATFVPPRGSYYNYASYYNPPGTFRRTAPPAGATTPMLETRPPIRVKFQGWGGSLAAKWKLSESLAIESISAYRDYDSFFSNDNDLSPLANSLGFGDLTFHSFSQELRLNGAALADNRIEYTLGLFYMDQKSVYATTQDLRSSPASLTQFQGDDPVNADTQAAFAHLAYHMTEKLTANLGLRYTDEHKDYSFTRRTIAGGLHPTLGSLEALNPYNYDGNNVDYRVNLQYSVNDDLMTYLQFATGFKGGGVSPRPFIAGQAVPFNPEKLKSYEIGVKSDMLDRRLRVNGSVFFSDYTDLQLTLLACPQFGAAPACAVVANAGNAEMKGAELEVVAKPTDGLSIDLSASLLKFKYTFIDPQAGGPTRPTGPQFGMRPGYVPKVKWSLGAQYEFNLANGSSITPRADVSFQGELFTNGFNALTNRINPYGVGNARVTWRAADKNWEASAEVTNITDKYYYVTRFDQFISSGVTDGQPGRPREYALTIKRKF